MAHVLDASALIAYFEKEPGDEKVQELLTAAARSMLGKSETANIVPPR